MQGEEEVQQIINNFSKQKFGKEKKRRKKQNKTV